MTKEIDWDKVLKYLRSLDKDSTYKYKYKNFETPSPFEEMLHLENLRLPFNSSSGPFLDYFFSKIIQGNCKSLESRFAPKDGFIYHATSLDALDTILADEYLYPGITLWKQGKLVSGELFEYIKQNGPEGHKFMNPDEMEKMGFFDGLEPQEKERIRMEYGHACSVSFGHGVLESRDYLPRDINKRAILGLSKPVLENYGYQFVDNKGEGLMCFGPVGLKFGLKQLLVPKEFVEDYKQKTIEKYLLKVYPIEDLDEKMEEEQEK